ncbi:hypothetical protein Q31a_13090 [Aureliella helgolandensis]|uniref:Uncharacterized protein n=1 Tax=Aureliella helgolandensis TaxID=2527968 RepID=A0A518G341_9BACT|nr:hypothetical protein Q31a_13090 [Aureliella helgolandensis]
MNRVLVAGIAGLAMLLTASVSSTEAYAGFGSCSGRSSCGGLFSGLGSNRCCGPEVRRDTCRPTRERCSGGLLAKLASRRASKCCGEPAPCCEPAPVACCEPAPVACCEPAPSCCAPAPVACCPAPAPSCCEAAPTCCEADPCGQPRRRLLGRRSNCCEAAPSCGGCAAPVSGCSSCGGSVISGGYVPGCPSCSTTLDSGVIIESAAPAAAPPAPAAPAAPAAPTADPAA